MIAWLPSIVTLVVLLITLAFGSGKLSQKIESLSKDVDNVRKDVGRIEDKLERLNQNFIEHLRDHNIP